MTFVSASGSAGTLGAGDYLKERHGTRIVVAEALECPTLLLNGFGEHNIRGIGDKHVPLIHNVMNSDLVVDVSDRATDQLNLLLNSEAGRRYLVDQAGVPADIVDALDLFGLSSLCNVIAAIKTAKHYQLDGNDVVMTVATDGAAMYRSESTKALLKYFGGEFSERTAMRVRQHLLEADASDVLELTLRERTRIFNLGYFTWVEQRGVSLDAFMARARPEFWHALRGALEAWDRSIERLNQEVGAATRSHWRGENSQT